MSRYAVTDKAPKAYSSVSAKWRLIKFFGWASLIANITIIATGGAVRLTGSGLGCPTWPTCTPDSLVPTAELSWHSAIEFGNRLMTGVLGIIAIVVLILVWRLRKTRRELFTLAIIVLLGIAAQAIVGGITVRTGLNPGIVGFHYFASIALVIATTVFVYLSSSEKTGRTIAVSPLFAVATHLLTGVLAITIIAGVITTAAGPHSGDSDVIRTGIDALFLAHLHSWPGYALFVLNVALLWWSAQQKYPATPWLLALIAVLTLQIIVGVYQARSGLPPLLIGMHMVIAAVSTSLTTVVVMKNKKTV